MAGRYFSVICIHRFLDFQGIFSAQIEVANCVRTVVCLLGWRDVPEESGVASENQGVGGIGFVDTRKVKFKMASGSAVTPFTDL